MSSVAASDASARPSTPPLNTQDVIAETESQMQQAMGRLTPFQVMLVQEQLQMEPSRLHARMCAYVKLATEVDAYLTAQASTTIDADSAAATAAAAASSFSTSAPSSSSSSALGAPAASSSPLAVPVPVLTHPSFLAALEDNLLKLLEERWEGWFSSVSTSDGKRISKAERHAKGMNKSSLVYGEVAFHSLGEVLWGPWCRSIPRGAVFVDLGSGTARGLLAAASLFPFAKLVGIEILEGLHNAAVEVCAHYDRSVRPTFDSTDPRSTQEIEVVCGSFLELDWPLDADVVFANSTCFDEQLMDDIATQGQALRDGVIVITLTKQLNSPYFKLVYSEQHLMSWGNATVNVMIKQTPSPEEIAEALVIQQKEKARQRRREGLE